MGRSELQRRRSRASAKLMQTEERSQSEGAADRSLRGSLATGKFASGICGPPKASGEGSGLGSKSVRVIIQSLSPGTGFRKASRREPGEGTPVDGAGGSEVGLDPKRVVVHKAADLNHS